MDRQVFLEDDEAFVPDEFSDGTQDDMEEFVEHEENFEVRPSISSRGSMGRATRDKKSNLDRLNHNEVTFHFIISDLLITMYTILI